MTCPSCSTPVDPGARFCGQCGAEVSRRGDERRVVTVVFADLVGFTALSESLDPERVKNLVDGCFRRLGEDVVAFGGRVDKIVGDAIVALFGAPVAHEDDAERAVRAALRMQESLVEHAAEVGVALQLRVGVNTGEVVVGRVGGGDYTAMGDVVNTASRLQSLADPGSVLVGASTHAVTSGVVQYEAVGDLSVRGRQGPVSTWRAIRPIGLPGHRVRRDLAPLVGRDDELALLAAAVDHSVRHRRSHLLLILGDAGTGKGRLASELGRYARTRHEAALLTGRCVPYGESQDWFAIADAVRSSLGLRPETTEAAAHDIVTAAVSSTRPTGSDGAVAGRSAGAGGRGGTPDSDDPVSRRTVTGLLHVLGYDTPLRSIDPERAAAEAHRAIRAALAAQAERGPVVLTLADLHWADAPLLDLVEAVLAHLLNHPFVIVATARHSLLDSWSARPGRSTVLALTLDPLSESAASRLLDELVSDDLDPAVRAELIGRAGGNPLFIEELAATVRGGASVDVTQLPGNLRALVAARLDGLSDAERRVIEDAAVLGRRGPLDGLAAMGHELRGSSDVSTTVRSLVTMDLLTTDESSWEFRSNLVREVAYERLPKAERARRHAGVAEYLSNVHMAGRRTGSFVAHHYRQAAELVREIGPVTHVPDDVVDRAVEAIVEAARTAESSESMERAARQYGEALALGGPDHARWIEIALLQARAHVGDHDLTAAAAAIDRLVARSLSPAERAAVVLLRAEVEQRTGDTAAAAESAREALAVFEAIGDRRGVGAALRVQGMSRLFAGDSDRAESLLDAAVVELAAADDRIGEAWARQNLAWSSFARGRADEAERRIDEALAVFTELGDQTGVAWSRGLLGFVRMFQGRLDESRGLAEETLVEARATGDRWGEGMMLDLLASVELWSGNASRACALSADAVDVLDATGDVVGRYFARALRGRALVHAGHIDEGFDLLRDSIAEIDRSGGVEEIVVTAAVLSAALLGDTARIDAWFGPDPAPPERRAGLDSERRFGWALHAVLQGRVDAARSLLEADSEAVSKSGFGLSLVAIERAIAGDAAAVAVAAARLDAIPGATFIDRTIAGAAAACVAARHGDGPAALAALSAIEVLSAGASDDVVVAQIVAWVTYVVAAALGSSEAPDRERDAAAFSRRLGVAEPRWPVVLGRAAGVETAVSATGW